MAETVAVAADAPAVWLVDKPAGPTSHTIVAGLRRRLGRRVKVGHAGTLDPFATGLLVVLSGRATRLMADLVGLDKRYRARVRTGFASATGDPEGPISAVGTPVGAAAVAAVVPRLLGRQMQRVPAFSAVRVDGERLYAKARRGEVVEAPEREITIHALEVVGEPEPGAVDVDVHCSSGTYIRQLAADIGRLAGAGGGYCAALRRTAVGGLTVDDALAPESLDPASPRDPIVALGHLERLEVDRAGARELAHGRPVAAVLDGRAAAICDGRTVAIVAGDGAGYAHPRVVLRTAEEFG